MSAQKGRRAKYRIADVLDQIRNGTPYTEQAHELGISADYLRAQIATAGYDSTTGLPRTTKPPRRAQDNQAPAVADLPDLPGALCTQVDPEIFFPDKGGPTSAAKAVCARCDVRTKCLTWAVDNGERYGVWGGVSERDRRKLEKGGTLPPARTCALPWCQVEVFGRRQYCSDSHTATGRRRARAA